MLQRFYETGDFVGLMVIVNNEEELMLLSMTRNLLEKIDYPTHIHVRAIMPTEKTHEIIDTFIQFWEDNVNLYIGSLSYSEAYRNEGIASSLNRCAEYLLNDPEVGYIGWFHPDMVGHPKWLSVLVKSMIKNQEAGKMSAYNNRDVKNPPSTKPYSGHEQCYLIRRGVLERIGLFDERYMGIGGYEDWDMNNRIREEGFEVLIEPKSVVRHLGMFTRSQKDQSFFEQMNRNYYYSKWGTYDERI